MKPSRKTTVLDKVGVVALTGLVAAAGLAAFAWYQVTEALSNVDWDNLNL